MMINDRLFASCIPLVGWLALLHLRLALGLGTRTEYCSGMGMNGFVVDLVYLVLELNNGV